MRGPVACFKRGWANVKVFRLGAIGFLLLAVVAAGCQSAATTVPNGRSPGVMGREHFRSFSVIEPDAVCFGQPVSVSKGMTRFRRPHASGNGAANGCIESAGQTATWAGALVLIPGSGTICGSVTWAFTPTTVFSASVVDHTNSTACNRTDNLTIKVTRAVGQPVPSPSPGSDFGSVSIEGMYTVDGVPSGMIGINVPVYAPPILEIEDGAAPVPIPISSPFPTASPLMVGQYINLQVIPVGGQIVTPSPPAAPITWVVPTTVPPSPPDPIASDILGSSPQPIGGAGESVNNANLGLYFLSGGTKKIEVIASMQLGPAPGSPFGPILQVMAEANYPIKSLGGLPTQTYGTPFIETAPGTATQPCPAPTAGIPNECLWGGSNAVQWVYEVSTPKGMGAGQIAVGQLISQVAGAAVGAEELQWCTSPTNQVSNLGNFLDNAFPYPASPSPNPGPGVTVVSGKNAKWTSQDSPGNTFPAGAGGDLEAWRQLAAQDYFMYEPTATGTRPSIWVTLAKSTWGFTESWTATNVNPPVVTAGTVQGYATAGVTGTGPVLSTELPVWSATASNSGDHTCT
jgi:hypothetical protein